MRRGCLPAALRAALAGLAATALWGCGKAAPEFPVPPTNPQPVLPAAAAASAGDTSVPDASTVFAPAPAASADPGAGRTNKPMSAAQQSAAMPVPGQNNDHSAPLGPARPASGR